MTLTDYPSSESNERTERFAIRNYKTYVAHYKSRQLIPMSLQEFLKNYRK